MWTLLAASAPPKAAAEDDDDGVLAPWPYRNGAPDGAGHDVRLARAHADAPPRSDVGPMSESPSATAEHRNGTEPALGSGVKVYLHPGGAAVGRMDVEQACAQFDLDAAPAFGSLDEATRACRGRNGFLVEVCRSTHGEDLEGHEALRTVFFVAHLRA